MDELTLEQAWNNVAVAASAFQGNQQQWNVLNASIAKVNNALTTERDTHTVDVPATNGKVDELTARS